MTVPAADFRIRLLKGFELSVDGQALQVAGGPQRLVIFLALHDRALSRCHVAGVLWPDVPADRASANLRASIWRIPAPCRPLVDLAAGRISLAAGTSVDYTDAVALAHRLLDSSGASQDTDLSSPARSQLASELLPACYEEWVLAERERFRQLRLHALEAQCARLTATGRYGEAIDAGLAAVAAEPLRESSHRALISAHLAEGNAAEAWRQYELYCQALLNELGVEPSDSLRELSHPTWDTRHQPAVRPARETVRAWPIRGSLTRPPAGRSLCNA